MKIIKGTLMLKIMAGGLAPALLCLLCSSTPRLEAQAPSALESQPPAAPAETSVSHTITLSQDVVAEYYEYEDLKVSVDQYQVKRGDSLLKLLRQRGMLASGSKADEAKMWRLVKHLNPYLKDPNAISPGQVLNLPALPGYAQESMAAFPQGYPDTAVKIYDRQVPGGEQQPARVVTMVRDPNDDPVQPLPSAPAPAATATTEGQTAQIAVPAAPATPSAPAAPSDPPPVITGGTPVPDASGGPLNLNFPSGNAGPLAMEPSNKVVYRTVRVRRGDSLERLLRREGMHRDLIYEHLLKLTLQLNPDIKDPNLIMAGAEIRIPAAGDYLTAMAGVNPQDVRTAALAISERRRPDGGGAGGGSGRPTERAAVLELPDEAAQSAKNSLGLIFTRLGDKVDSRGTVLLPADDGGGVELNTSSFPMVELANGARVVLDPGSRLSSGAVKNLGRLNPPYKVFRTGRKETLDRALGRLWPLCGYFRVYGSDRTYEGGGDIRLQINADWMIWTTQEAWNSGQPIVINRARSPERRTSPAWTAFLEAHGIKVMDVYGNQLLAAQEAPAASTDLKVVQFGNDNPSLLAAELVKILGGEPLVGVQIDMAQAQDPTLAPNVTAPVLWEVGGVRVVLEFGEIPSNAIDTLRKNGYKVISSPKDPDAVVAGVLNGFGLKAQPELTVSAPAGGPKMSLAITGQLIKRGDQKYLITRAPLPSGLAALLEPDLRILKY